MAEVKVLRLLAARIADDRDRVLTYAFSHITKLDGSPQQLVLQFKNLSRFRYHHIISFGFEHFGQCVHAVAFAVN